MIFRPKNRYRCVDESVPVFDCRSQRRSTTNERRWRNHQVPRKIQLNTFKKNLLHVCVYQFSSHLMGTFYRTIRLIENGIKPVYVFDGKPPSMKSSELDKRAERRQEAQKALEKAEEAGINFYIFLSLSFRNEQSVNNLYDLYEFVSLICMMFKEVKYTYVKRNENNLIYIYIYIRGCGLVRRSQPLLELNIV